MKHLRLIPAALAAAPTSNDVVTRAVRSPNGKDPFVRILKVPAATTVRGGPAAKAATPLVQMCVCRTGDRPDPAPPAKG